MLFAVSKLHCHVVLLPDRVLQFIVQVGVELAKAASHEALKQTRRAGPYEDHSA